MVRKPQPRDAAARIRRFLANEGFELSQRKALELVAIVEGHRNWQSMQAAERNAKPANTAKPRQTLAPWASEYTRWWEQVREPVKAFMERLRGQLTRHCLDEYRPSTVQEDLDDENRFTLWIEDKQAPGEGLVYVDLKLVQNETNPGQFALRLTVDYPALSRELLSWTSGRNYSEDLWSSSPADLLERLSWFSTEEVTAAIANSEAYRYLKSS